MLLVSFSLADESGDPESGSTAALVEKGPPTSVIVPIYRRDCHQEVYAGTHAYPGPGVYLLKFDNTYSLWRSKTLYYRVYYTRWGHVIWYVCNGWTIVALSILEFRNIWCVFVEYYVQLLYSERVMIHGIYGGRCYMPTFWLFDVNYCNSIQFMEMVALVQFESGTGFLRRTPKGVVLRLCWSLAGTT